MKVPFVMLAAVLVGVFILIAKRPTPLIRGIADGMLVSPAMPDVAVAAGPGFRPSDAARFEVLMPVRNVGGDRVTAVCYYALWERSDAKARLSALFSEVDEPYFWPPTPDAPSGAIRSRRSNIAGFGGMATTLVRPAADDPWHDDGDPAPWDGTLLVRRYSYPAFFLRFAIVVEYREPLPETDVPIEDLPAELAKFEMRADAAFKIVRRDDDALPRPTARLPYAPGHMSRQPFADYLGELVMEERN